MGCCSLKSRRADVSLWSVMLVCAPLQIAGGLLTVSLWLPSRLLPSMATTRASLDCLLNRNREVVNRRLRPTGLRCHAAGLLLRYWPKLSGLVFRNAYPALVSTPWIAGAATLCVAVAWVV